MRQPGTGAASIYGYVDGDRSGGRAGLGLDLEAKLRRELGLYATGRISERWGRLGYGLAYEAMAGLRWKW